MNPIAQRLRSLAARTALDGIAEEMRAIADEIALAQQAQEPVAGLHESGTLKLSKDMDEILALRPAVEPMTDEVRRSYQCLLAMNTPHGFGDRIGPFVKWLQDSGVTAKAEGVRDGDVS